MAVDPNAIVQGVASSMVTERVKQHAEESLREAQGKEKRPSLEDYLHEIHLLLVEMVAYLKHTQAVQGDLYRFVTIYKIGLGPPFIPNHHSDRQNFTILCNAAVTLNVTASALGTFNISTKLAPDWTPLNFPEMSSYTLDVSAATNSIQVWLRETNASIV